MGSVSSEARPHRLELARRAGKHEHDRPPPPAGAHDEPGRGADGLEHGCAPGDRRLLARARGDCLHVDAREALAQRGHDRADARLERLVEHHLEPLELRHGFGREVVGGRAEAAAGDHEVEPLPCHEPQRVEHVGVTVAHDRDLGELDPGLTQAFGEPGPVAVASGVRRAPRCR